MQQNIEEIKRQAAFDNDQQRRAVLAVHEEAVLLLDQRIADESARVRTQP
jgi:hypothetical protein